MNIMIIRLPPASNFKTFGQESTLIWSGLKHSFQHQWFNRCPWLHYDEDQVDINNHFSIQIHIFSYIIA